jgi:hypothetical protein
VVATVVATVVVTVVATVPSVVTVLSAPTAIARPVGSPVGESFVGLLLRSRSGREMREEGRGVELSGDPHDPRKKRRTDGAQ